MTEGRDSFSEPAGVVPFERLVPVESSRPGGPRLVDFVRWLELQKEAKKPATEKQKRAASDLYALLTQDAETKAALQRPFSYTLYDGKQKIAIEYIFFVPFDFSLPAETKIEDYVAVNWKLGLPSSSTMTEWRHSSLLPKEPSGAIVDEAKERVLLAHIDQTEKVGERWPPLYERELPTAAFVAPLVRVRNSRPVLFGLDGLFDTEYQETTEKAFFYAVRANIKKYTRDYRPKPRKPQDIAWFVDLAGHKYRIDSMNPVRVANGIVYRISEPLFATSAL